MAAFAGLMGFSVTRGEAPVIASSGDALLTPDSFSSAGATEGSNSSIVDLSTARPWPKREREESNADVLLFSETRGGFEGHSRNYRGTGGQRRGEPFHARGRSSHSGRGRGGGGERGRAAAGGGGTLVVLPSMYANPWADLERIHGLPPAIVLRPTSTSTADPVTEKERES